MKSPVNQLLRSLAPSSQLEILSLLPPKGKNRGRRVKVKCHCGKEFEARLQSIKSGNTTSCGCMNGKKKPIKKETKTILMSQRRQPYVTPKRTPKLPVIEGGIDSSWEEEEHEREQRDNLLQEALEHNSHMDPEWFADRLGFRLYQLKQMSHEELDKLFTENRVFQ